MKPTLQQTCQRLASIALSKRSAARIREHLVAYADMHPVVSTAPAPWYRASWFSMRTVQAFAVLVVVVGTGAGATAAAERAVPGDALYAIKTGVNERVSLVLATTPLKKARYSALLAERRVDEAVALADAGKLDTETADELDAAVAVHLASSDAATDELEASGDLAAALMVRTDLETHIAERAQAFMPSTLRATTTENELVDARAAFATRLTARAHELALARRATESVALPGIATADTALDLALLRDGEDVTRDEDMAVAKAPSDDPVTATLAAKMATTTPEEATSTEDGWMNSDDDIQLLRIERSIKPLEADAQTPLWLRLR